MEPRSRRLSPDALSPGTHLLGLSPPMEGLTRLTDEYLADGLDAGDGCLLVTTDRPAEAAAASVADLATDPDPQRLGVVDATGQEPAAESVPCRLETVGSPADLTGIGISVSELLEATYGSVEGIRVVVDSVSSLLVYAGFDRVYKFLHTSKNRIDSLDGNSVWLLSADTDRAAVAKFETLFDGVVEVRGAPTDPEFRVRGEGQTGGWRPLPTGGRTWIGPTDVTSAGESIVESLGGTASLRSVIDAVDAAGLTLTLCNYDGDESARETLSDYFERLNVTVRTADLSTETPANVGLLHRESDVLATSGTSELHAAVELRDDLEAVAEPDVLESVHRDEYSVADGTKQDLVRISRLIESRALGTTTGTLHAGFQDVSRLDDELDTRNLYEAIAGTDVAVHLYGRDGEVPNADRYVLHTGDDDELTGSWFVVYDGGGQDDRKGALVCEETSPERYSGFWSYQPAVVDAVASYLERTYGTA